MMIRRFLHWLSGSRPQWRWKLTHTAIGDLHVLDGFPKAVLHRASEFDPLCTLCDPSLLITETRSIPPPRVPPPRDTRTHRRIQDSKAHHGDPWPPPPPPPPPGWESRAKSWPPRPPEPPEPAEPGVHYSGIGPLRMLPHLMSHRGKAAQVDFPQPSRPPRPGHADTSIGTVYCPGPAGRTDCADVHDREGHYHRDGTPCRGWRHWLHL